MGVFQADHFKPNCTSGDTVEEVLNYWKAFPSGADLFVFLTASNLNLNGENVAVVGTVLGLLAPFPPATPFGGFGLSARNSDIAEGDCAFYYAAMTQGVTGGDAGTIQVDSGQLDREYYFSAAGSPGDWQSVPVYFNQPFMTPPVVLLTANGVPDQPQHVCFPVGIAQNVTPNGFTLAARNSDCAGGLAGFYWVALGCGLGCG